nr:hypothetical protein [Lachnospiraceae bacterium]
MKKTNITRMASVIMAITVALSGSALTGCGRSMTPATMPEAAPAQMENSAGSDTAKAETYEYPEYETE